MGQPPGGGVPAARWQGARGFGEGLRGSDRTKAPEFPVKLMRRLMTATRIDASFERLCPNGRPWMRGWIFDEPDFYPSFCHTVLTPPYLNEFYIIIWTVIVCVSPISCAPPPTRPSCGRAPRRAGVLRPSSPSCSLRPPRRP